MHVLQTLAACPKRVTPTCVCSWLCLWPSVQARPPPCPGHLLIINPRSWAMLSYAHASILTFQVMFEGSASPSCFYAAGCSPPAADAGQRPAPCPLLPICPCRFAYFAFTRALAFSTNTNTSLAFTPPRSSLTPSHPSHSSPRHPTRPSTTHFPSLSIHAVACACQGSTATCLIHHHWPQHHWPQPALTTTPRATITPSFGRWVPVCLSCRLLVPILWTAFFHLPFYS